jgi:glycosyltransferase involved in cell wall biosynthesis
MKIPKVSIIIPIYNVEQYIERCARSLFEQTEEDLEFIFVNDGTPDNSMQILHNVIKDYPFRKNQIKIFANEKNLGLPLTRQRGLKEATGEYIIHCDSDDWVDKDMYRILYEKAKTEDLDMVWCDFYRTDLVTNDYVIQDTDIDNIAILKAFLHEKKGSYLWNHLVKRNVVFDHDYIKPILNYLEDMVLVTQYVYYSNKIGYVKAPLYYYYKNSESITTPGSKERELYVFIEDEVSLRTIFSFLKQKELDTVLKDDIFNIKFLYKMRMMYYISNIKDCNLWVRYFKDINISALFDHKVSLKDKINFLLVESRLYPLKNRILRRQ